ncbi:peptidoglycan editing factor PgeF [Paenibacillus sp. 1011MAR3C5]|uniref:peptidoglycan editing factor PgeF n=1 Tax=Paenibacillus sp. 1011MAR3C5 TaxID=1675787 RepID=UPI000E6CEDDE|nr:peptidoglycan editing factor PgeF [Paenibacillus sp. 1011MAR3C5]RJE90756.1 peptidoglycan editing factor PgeF [Paenibacillus sp. 1011MAR3C5]
MEPFVQSKREDTAKEPSLFLLPEWINVDERLTAGFTGRSGGVSGEPWTGLNIGLHVGDDEEAVILNRKRVTEALGWPFEAWTCAEQVHGNRVAKVTLAERGKGKERMDDTITGCDALMTDVPGVLLTSFYADCVPLYFYAPDQGAVALAHAGWRGTVGEIAAMTVEAMEEAYGVQRERIFAAIGPSIGDCCYEVDGPVMTEVDRVMRELNLPEEEQASCMQRKENGKASLNLKELNRQIMIKAGILPSRIELTTWCTGCRTDLFYSYRVEGGKTGRMASWIGIRER